MVPAFDKHILKPRGKEHVHVFFHTSPPAVTGREDTTKEMRQRESQEIMDMYQHLVRPEVLKAVVVTNSD